MSGPWLAPFRGAQDKFARFLRPDFEDIRDGIIWDLLCQKFQDPRLREALLNTGSAYLIEGNVSDD